MKQVILPNPQNTDITPVAIADEYLNAINESNVNIIRTTTRNNDTDSLTSLQKAAEDYQQGRYNETLTTIETLPQDTSSSSVVLLQVSTYFKLGRYSEATALLQELSQQQTISIKQQAEWQLFLLQVRKLPQSQTLYNEMQTKLLNDTLHTFHKEAQNVKKELSAIGF